MLKLLLLPASWVALDRIPYQVGPPPPVMEERVADARDGIPLAGKPGFCLNPFTNGPVDVRGLPPGTVVVDPEDPVPGRVFRVPEPAPEGDQAREGAVPVPVPAGPSR